MVVSKEKIEDERIYVEGIPSEKVTRYNYIKCELDEQLDRSLEIKRSKVMALSVFNKQYYITKNWE